MIYQPSPFKRCPACGQPRFFSEFRKDKQTKDHLRTYCNICEKERRTKRYIRDREIEIAHAREWQKANPEKVREYDRRRNKTEKRRNREREYQRRHRVWHPDRVRERQQRYIQNNPDARRETTRQYRQNHRDHIRQDFRRYYRANPERYKIAWMRRQARKRSLPATFTEFDWQRAVAYFNGCCAVCGRPRGFFHVLAKSHWIPQDKGGGYTPANIIPLCHGIDGCNNHQGNKMPEEWLIQEFGKRKAKAIIKRIEEYFQSVNQHN